MYKGGGARCAENVPPQCADEIKAVYYTATMF